MKKKIRVTEGWILIERLHKATDLVVDEVALAKLENYMRVVLVGDKCKFVKADDAIVLNPHMMTHGVAITDMTTKMHYYLIPESAAISVLEGELKAYFVDTCKMTTKDAFDKLEFSAKMIMPKARA